MMLRTIGDNELKLKVGDITEQKTDAIVNAANGTLMGGGGVDGAIHQRAGKKLLEECKQVRENQLGGSELATGKAVMTKGYNLPASFVIHTVGPVWNGDKEKKEELLANCYRNSLELAVGYKLTSIAFPSISTGVYHFPVDLAARTALKEVVSFLESHAVGSVVFVLFSESDYQVYAKELENLK